MTKSSTFTTADADRLLGLGDLVEWFAAWIPKVRVAIAATQGQEAGTAG
jgi:hypothetical protein